jgi:hypothetical protein
VLAGKDFMGDREAVAVDHEADHHLFAVRSVVARIPALGLAIGSRLAFRIMVGFGRKRSCGSSVSYL